MLQLAPALAPAAAGKLNAKLKSDFHCNPNNGHAETASAGPFCATSRLMHCNRGRRSSGVHLSKMYTPDEMVEARRRFSAETAADALLGAKPSITEQAQCDEFRTSITVF